MFVVLGTPLLEAIIGGIGYYPDDRVPYGVLAQRCVLAFAVLTAGLLALRLRQTFAS